MSGKDESTQSLGVVGNEGARARADRAVPAVRGGGREAAAAALVPPGAEGREGEGAVAGPSRRRGMGHPPRGRGQNGLARPLPAPAAGGRALPPTTRPPA